MNKGPKDTHVLILWICDLTRQRDFTSGIETKITLDYLGPNILTESLQEGGKEAEGSESEEQDGKMQAETEIGNGGGGLWAQVCGTSRSWKRQEIFYSGASRKSNPADADF